MGFVDFVYNPEGIIAILVAVATFATIMTVALPYLQQDRLGSRLKSVANRREELRRRQRETLAKTNAKKQLRSTPAAFMREFLYKFNLERMAESEELRNKLAQAGLRGQKPLISFLFFRFTLPIVFMGGAAFYLFFVNDVGQPPGVRSVVVLVAAFIGFFLPSLLVQNIIQKRRQSIMKAFPDALDLLLICVESGMSIEAAFNKVAHEVGTQSVELAEEMALTTAELSYLQDRRTAYENLAMRTGHPGVKAVCTSLVQAEKYGSPVGQALRIMSEENRQMRMNAAEKKAAALPAQLTVPMITFFLPVLFVVILGPTAIQFIFK